MKNRIISAIVAITLALSGAYTLTACAKDRTVAVVLYSANLRGNLSAVAKVAALKDDYINDGIPVALVDVGNFLQGTVYTSYDSGKGMVKLMKQAGYDAVTLGTHEFDFGTGKVGVAEHGVLYEDGSLGEISKSENLTALSVNVRSGESAAYTESAVIALGKTTIGVVGITSTETKNNVLETNLTNISFLDNTAACALASSTLGGLGAEYTLCLSNDGNVKASNVAADVFIGVSEQDAQIIGAAKIMASGNVKYEKLTISGVAPKTEVQKTVTELQEAVSSAVGEKVYSSKVTLNGSKTDNRSTETNLGDFWTDALLWYAKEGNIAADFTEEAIKSGNTGITVNKDNIVAVWNGGNLRDYINQGDVYKKDLERVLPYPNKVAVIYLSGSQLAELIEAASEGLPYASEKASICASFVQTSGIKYTIDLTKQFDLTEETYKTHWKKVNTVKCVTITEINGKPFDKTAIYAVISSNAVAGGMDSNYVCLDKGANSTVTAAKVVDVVSRYIGEKLGGEISQDYLTPQARITVIR